MAVVGRWRRGNVLSLNNSLVQFVNDYVVHTLQPAHIFVSVSHHSSLVTMVSALFQLLTMLTLIIMTNNYDIHYENKA